MDSKEMERLRSAIVVVVLAPRLLGTPMPTCVHQTFDIEKPGRNIGDTITNPKDGTVFVWVPAGTYRVAGETKTLGGYWIAKNLTTWKQYKRFCSETGKSFPNSPKLEIQDNFPATLNWADATAYAHWAGCSLPTVEQWEKAALGTDGRTYPWGSTFDRSKFPNTDGAPSPIGKYPSGASPYGCLDMDGNVAQWTSTYDPDQPSGRIPTNIGSDGKIHLKLSKNGGWIKHRDGSYWYMQFAGLRGYGSWNGTACANNMAYGGGCNMNTEASYGIRIAGPILPN